MIITFPLYFIIVLSGGIFLLMLQTYLFLTKDKRVASIRQLSAEQREKQLKGYQPIMKIMKIYLWGIPFAIIVMLYLVYGHPNLFHSIVLLIIAYVMLIECFIISRSKINELNRLKNDNRISSLEKTS